MAKLSTPWSDGPVVVGPTDPKQVVRFCKPGEDDGKQIARTGAALEFMEKIDLMIDFLQLLRYLEHVMRKYRKGI